jgi:hypothetical protein
MIVMQQALKHGAIFNNLLTSFRSLNPHWKTVEIRDIFILYNIC